jgi:outer membrane protein OmpA-like peptidoglycan-associated protein
MLRIGASDDPLEHEADRVAERVVGMQATHSELSVAGNAGAGLQRKCACGGTCPDCEKKELLQMKSADANGAARAAAPAIVHDVLSSPGQPLDESTRAFMEPRFGQDFSGVRVHSDARAAESARSVNALAYTVGTNVVFGPGQYFPNSNSGQRLLAHELTHVVQQKGSPATLRRQPGPTGGAPDQDALARSAEIALSQLEPGQVTGTARPPAFSMYAYAIDDAHPKDEHAAFLLDLASLIKNGPSGLIRVLVIGNTDSTGEASHNQVLSEQRAAASAAILRAHGVSDVQTVGRGENDPVEGNDSLSGRSRNRRVDLQLVALKATSRKSAPRSTTPGPQATPQAETPQPTPKPPTDTPPPTVTPPPGVTPPTVTPPPQDTTPPVVKPPTDDTTPPGGGDEDTSFCEDHPYVCGALGGAAALGAVAAGIAGAIETVGGGLGVLACLAQPELCLVGPHEGTLPPPPPPPPPKGREPEKKPDEPPKIPKVTFSTVRGDSTPDSVPDRIPPRIDTEVAVTVTDRAPDSPPIVISIPAGGAILGNATVEGDTSASITGSTVIDVRGVLMTHPDRRPGALQLVATHGMNKVGTSNYFAVTAIPQNASVTFEAPLKTGSHLGVSVQTRWESDSGQITDLDAVQWKESVEETMNDGIFEKRPPTETQKLKATANRMPVLDRHGTPVEWLTDTGRSETRQLLEFEDRRVGSFGNAMKNSGFLIVREAKEDATRTALDPLATCLTFTTSKTGASGSANGLQSDAGLAVPDPCVAEFELPCLHFGPAEGGPGHGGNAPSSPGQKGGGAGNASGGQAATRIHPKPIAGSFPGQSAPVFYAGGLPEKPEVGVTYPVRVTYTLSGQLFAAEVPYKVEDASGDPVLLTSQNDEPWNMAPDGQPPSVLEVHSQAHVHQAQLRAK